MDTSSNQPNSKQDYTLVDVEDPDFPLAALMEKEIHNLDPISTTPCIYRVPPTLRQANEKSYTPQIVSIGPFHHGKMELGTWEKKKVGYLKDFLDRTKKRVEDCIELVKKKEENARRCYAEIIDLPSDKFVKMMLLDSCFIIENMRRAVYDNQVQTDFIVRRDMILLENQIPFFVLCDLYELGSSKEEGEGKFIDLSIEYFSDRLLLTVTEEGDEKRIIENVQKVSSGFEIKHLTDLLRVCHLPTISVLSRSKFVRIPTAARLHEVGMEFKTGTRKALLDIEYKQSGLLEIPKFRVLDNTECLLKNLIALETCHYPFDGYIIDYVNFLRMFIATATDADLLIESGIIAKAPCDSAAVASLFNNLGVETKFGKYYFKIISEGINAYYKVPRHKWIATFKRDYCSTPWKAASTAAAIILLVLTLIQTICSIIPLF